MLKMLWTGEYDEEGFQSFSKYFDIRFTAGSMANRLNEEQLIEELQGKDVFLIGYDPLTEEVLKHCPDLKLVLSVRDGPEENIDIRACEKMGIPVLSSSGRCTVSVAELTFCMMLLLARPVISVSNYIHEHGWTADNKKDVRALYDNTATELYGKVCGVIGLGRNGRALADRAKAFGMKIVAYDPYVSEEKMHESGFKKVELDELMSISDYVVVLARLTSDTEGMVGKEQIKLMKKSACLVNTARGKLIDTDALIDALENNDIRAAALDAHGVEPLGLNNRELTVDPSRLIITPHMAGKTKERNWHQCQLLLNHWEKYYNGEDVNMPYTPNVRTFEGYEFRGGVIFGLANKE